MSKRPRMSCGIHTKKQKMDFNYFLLKRMYRNDLHFNQIEVIEFRHWERAINNVQQDMYNNFNHSFDKSDPDDVTTNVQFASI